MEKNYPENCDDVSRKNFEKKLSPNHVTLNTFKDFAETIHVAKKPKRRKKWSKPRISICRTLFG